MKNLDLTSATISKKIIVILCIHYNYNNSYISVICTVAFNHRLDYIAPNIYDSVTLLKWAIYMKDKWYENEDKMNSQLIAETL